MFHTQEFDSYRITYYSRWSPEAQIQFSSKGRWVGSISFAREGETIGLNSVTNDFIDLYFPISRFNDIINILRNEKPLALGVDTDNAVGSLYTLGSEPIGEQE